MKSFADVNKCNGNQFVRYFKTMLDSGIYLAPSQYEAGFVSAAHTKEDLENTNKACYKALKELKA